MFDFLFGGKRKLAIIRELVEQRMRRDGYNDINSRIKVKELGGLELLGTPEGMIVTVLETAMSLQRRGLMLGEVIGEIEGHRAKLGTNTRELQAIKKIASGPLDQAHTSMPMYCVYRMNLEFPGKMTDDQLLEAYCQATEALMH